MHVSLVQSLWRRIGRGLTAAFIVAALAFSPTVVHADNYGSGNYGSDIYGSSSTPSSDGGSSGSGSSGTSGSSSSAASSTPASSSPTAESTVIETESGLQVAINLSNGQAIPSTGYYITITPLNGQGKSFDKAEIYLDGKLVHSGVPDETGTLRWLWDTNQNPATKVKIIVFGPGSGTTTHEFDVTVAPAETSNTQTPPATDTPAANPATGLAWPLWLVLALAGGILLILVLVIWAIIRRRRSGQSPPPPTAFTPMQ